MMKTVVIQGEILDAADIIRQLGDAPHVRLIVDSNGGDSSAALAVWEALQGRDVEVTITGKCFSAAVTVMMSGRVIRIHPDARMMLHRPVNHVVCDSEQMRVEAKHLDKLTSRIIGIVAVRTRRPIEEVARWYTSGVDTYFTAQEALAAGLVDEILPADPQGPGKDLSIVPAAPDRAPFTDKELLLFECFRALGTIQTHDRARLHREVSVWLAHNARDNS